MIRCHRRHGHGFSLIEVMVALAVIGLSLGAAFASLSWAQNGAIIEQARLGAQLIASNQMAKLRAGLTTSASESGDATVLGQRYQWAQRTEPTPNPLIAKWVVQVRLNRADAAATPEWLMLAERTAYVAARP